MDYLGNHETFEELLEDLTLDVQDFEDDLEPHCYRAGYSICFLGGYEKKLSEEEKIRLKKLHNKATRFRNLFIDYLIDKKIKGVSSWMAKGIYESEHEHISFRKGDGMYTVLWGKMLKYFDLFYEYMADEFEDL